MPWFHLVVASSVGRLNVGGLGGRGGVLREGEVNGLCPGGAFRWVLHGCESFGKCGMAEVGLTFVTIDTVEEGGDFKKLETCIHEVEILDFFLRWHVER